MAWGLQQTLWTCNSRPTKDCLVRRTPHTVLFPLSSLALSLRVSRRAAVLAYTCVCMYPYLCVCVLIRHIHFARLYLALCAQYSTPLLSSISTTPSPEPLLPDGHWRGCRALLAMPVHTGCNHPLFKQWRPYAAQTFTLRVPQLLPQVNNKYLTAPYISSLPHTPTLIPLIKTTTRTTIWF